MSILSDRRSWEIHGNAATRHVFVGTDRLDHAESLKHVNHSPDGFNWGYGGSGPAQLAFALLLKFFGPTAAKQLYQQFKVDYVSTWRQDEDFHINLEEIWRWILRQSEAVEAKHYTREEVQELAKKGRWIVRDEDLL